MPPQVITEEKIAQAKDFVLAHMGDAKNFNEDGWRYILEKHGGKLPLVIKAVPEGTIVPNSNVLFCMENTDPVRPSPSSLVLRPPQIGRDARHASVPCAPQGRAHECVLWMTRRRATG